ncbi:zinc finger CCCH domain-containing protein 66-like [Cicer arietinum]|uniref:Zinc finger CCCH domain-containing protein 66-like n=1 Tax=Cicer arietinum TaxID=3827 RepID=A0A1S2XLR2_CICAR|nr:zinc finger CCCH domain-containing protein 66-like [Cicer arietinum]XP_027187761.1 zinc finger CCCH domain-containing protein 66-like [Cicer arietinum]
MGYEIVNNEGLGQHHEVSSLLEFSAADDLISFRDAVEKEGCDVDGVGLWYGRRVGSNKLGYEERTPLMVAAIFGSLGVSAYILATGYVDVNRSSGSDGATALHCAVAGGSAASVEIIKLLLDASADASAVDVNGNRPVDLIVSVANSIFNPRKRMLQALLEGIGGADWTCLTFPEEISFGHVDEQQRQDVNMPRVSKDYPVDLSLPDINNGIFSTDEFRMYTFKVKPCSRAYSHDWTECPFVHPGENARRRDPKMYNYTCVPCPEFRKGSCSKGDLCEYAHGIFECWLHPAQYRTRLCKDESSCTRRVCFFAHKLEELRPLYASTGSAIPSPRSYSGSASALEMGSLSPIALGSPSVMIPPSSTTPLTPSGASSAVAAASMWQTQSNVSVPTLQLPKSRFNTAITAGDFDSSMAMLQVETQRRRQQQLKMDEISGLSSPSNWKNSMPNSPSFQVSLSDHTEDIFGSHDPSILHNKFHGISLDAAGLPQLQSPTGIQMHPSMNQQQQNYSSCHSPTYRFDRSGEAAAAALNARAAAFSKRSQSFIERSVANRYSELLSPPNPYAFSNWGSPDGKLNWAIHGEELNKLRKSSSFGFRSSSTPLTTAATQAPENDDEPDVSWVNSLVKDVTPQESGQYKAEYQQRKLQYNLNNGTNAIPAWLEQMYMEQEQMVH